jgi:hypothetical protein
LHTVEAEREAAATFSRRRQRPAATPRRRSTRFRAAAEP